MSGGEASDGPARREPATLQPASDGASPVRPWRRADTAVAAALAAAACAFYWPLFAPGPYRRWFVDGDFVDQFVAFARFEAAELAAGRWPHWNPFAYSGGPFWADIQAAVAYPPSLIVTAASLALEGGTGVAALQLEAVAHLALAAVGTFVLARRRLGARDAAALSAVAFACGGYLTGYPPLQLAVLESNAWLPWALWAVDRVAAGGRGRDAALLAAALAMGVLAGHPQSALYLGYTVAAFALWRIRPWRATPRRTWAALAAGAAGAVGLSAAGWLPAAAFLALSNRADASYEMLGHGFPPRELLGLAVPGLTQWSPLYVGLVPLGLAVAAAVAWLRGPGGGAADGGGEGDRAAGDDGGPGGDVDGSGVDVGRPGGDGDPPSAEGGGPAPTDGAGFWLALAAVGLVLSLGAGSIAFDAAYHLAPGFGLFRGQERAAFVVSFALAMLAGHGLAARRRTAALAIGVIVLAWLDLHAVGARVNLAASPPAELAVTPIVAVIRENAGLGRVHDDDRLPRNAGVLHGWESTGGASPLVLRPYLRLRDGLLPAHEARFWQLTATAIVVSWRDGIDGAQPVIAVGEGDARTTVHALANPAPFAWRAHTAVPVASDDEALDRLRDPAFDPFGTVLVHDGAPGGGPHGSDGATGVDGRTPAGHVSARTDGGTPGWLVFSEVWHPGWRATIDGAPAPVLRADVALIAVAVPPGAHQVSLAFRDPWVGWGVSVSVLTVVAGLAAAVWGWRRRR